jgi:putative YhdH/YhfP family quinone oxidoreductase
MRAFVVDDTNGQLTCELREVEPSRVDESDCLVKVEYSSVNFKDAMVASAPSRVRRVNTLVGGVDAAGVVEDSRDDEVAPGTRVAVHGGTLGVARDGGFAEFVFASRRHLSILPPTISARDAMVIGTAGFTAMASVLALEDRGLKSGAQVLVTGATGGVGSQAVTYLALRGYAPVASTGSLEAAPWLHERGAERVIGRSELSDRPDRMLGSELWDGAIDCVGGETLHEVLRSLRYGATVAASGVLAGADFATTLYPFITRAVALVGIDSVEASPATRQRVWQALGELAPRLDFTPLVDRVIGLDGIASALEDVRAGRTRGRILVQLDAKTATTF